MASANPPLFSFIIPVYNGGSVIERCLDSISGQTYSLYEVIIVDDGSEDTTREIVDKYSGADARIRYYWQENKGVSAARNKGIELSKNEFVLFVDADDFLEPDYLEQFCRDLGVPGNNINTFIIQNFTAYIYRADGKLDVAIWTHFIYGYYTQEEMFTKLLKLRWPYYGVPFAKLFRLSIIRNHQLRFVEGMNFKEDLIFQMEYLKHIPAVRFTESSKYNYTIDKSKPTLTNAIASFHSEHLFFQHFKQLSEYYINKYELDDENKRFFYRIAYEGFFRCINSCMYTYKVPMPARQRLRHLRSLVTSENLKYLNLSGIIDNKMKRLAFIILKLRLYRLYDMLNVMRYR